MHQPNIYILYVRTDMHYVRWVSLDFGVWVKIDIELVKLGWWNGVACRVRTPIESVTNKHLDTQEKVQLIVAPSETLKSICTSFGDSSP